MAERPSKALYLRLPESLHAAVAALAEREHRSMNRMVETILEQYVDEHEPSFDERMKASIADVQAGRTRTFDSTEEFLADLDRAIAEDACGLSH